MPRVFLGNFGFEHELTATARRQLPEAAERTNRELALAWITMAHDEDFILVPEAIEPEWFAHVRDAGLASPRIVTRPEQVPHGTELVPWGWTQECVRLAAHYGWSADAPSPHAVRTGNSRRFSMELEHELGVGLDGAAVVQSAEDLERHLAGLAADAPWVVKANFGMSARERILSRGPTLSAPSLAWAVKRIQADGCVIFEPWVERISEVGLQFTVPKRGAAQLEGITPLLSDRTGQYRGSRFAPDSNLESIWSSAVEADLQAADKLQALGYFGPLGIDAMRYRDVDGEERIRPLQDINARHTMGRLSLGLRRLLRAEEVGSWLHVRWATQDLTPTEWLAAIVPSLPEGVRVVRTSPITLGGEPVQHGTIALVAKDAQSLDGAETVVLMGAESGN